MSQVAVLIPLMRPHRIAPVVQSIQESTTDYHIVVIATGECADAARELPVTLLEDDGGTWPKRINRGYELTTEPYVLTAADDLEFRSGWFEAIERAMPNADGVAAVNDLHNMAGVHFVLGKKYIQEFGCIDAPGTIAHGGYEHSYVDDEIRATAISHDRWLGVITDSVVEHMHVGRGKAPMDEIYRIGEASMSQGYALYTSRAHLWQQGEL